MNKSFNLDRSITLGLIITIIVQSAGVFIWAGAAEARISQLEAESYSYLSVAERLARLEEQMLMARQSLTRIETRLEGYE